jgi:hypothetical protein
MLFAKYLPGMYQGADHTGRRVLNFGGGGGGPTQSTVTQSNIPEWLQPQTEALLGAATQEYFETTPRELTKFKTETRVDPEGNTTEVQVPDGTEMMYDITGDQAVYSLQH